MPENTIRYWIEDSDEYPLFYHENGEIKGIFADILAQLEESSGRTVERVTMNGDAPVGAEDATDMLACGQLDLVLGLPREVMNGRQRAICTSETIYSNWLTAVVLPDSPQVPAENIGNFYWGADSFGVLLTAGTDAEGHTLDYAGRTELLNALKAHDIYGALVRRSTVDYDIYAGHEYKYREYGELSIPYSECVSMNLANTELNELVNEICAQSFTETGLSHAEYANMLMDASSHSTVNGYLAFGGIVLSAVLAILCTVLAVRAGRRRKLDDARLAAMIADNPDKELFELDLNKQKLKAYNGFAIFKEAPADLSDTVTLTELSELLGFDFTEHYAAVRKVGTTVYKNRFIIHVGGSKRYIMEDGRRMGHTLFFMMTDVSANVEPGTR